MVNHHSMHVVVPMVLGNYHKMNKLNIKTSLYVAVAFNLLVTANTLHAATDKRLAYSSSAGVEVLSHGENWCDQKAVIELKVTNDDFFTTDQANNFLKKIGTAVIPAECPKAEVISVIGTSNSTGKTIFNGSASKNDSWTLVSATAVTVNPEVTEKAEQSVEQTQASEVTSPASSDVALPEESTSKNIADIKKSEPVDEKSNNDISEKVAVDSDSSEKKQEVTTPKVDTKDPNLNNDIADKKAEPKETNFTVGDYLPRIGSTSFSEPEKDAIVVTTLENCNIYDFQNKLRKDWIAFPKGDFKCIDGSLNGNGEVEFKDLNATSQGSLIGNVINGHFFAEIPKGWQPQRFEMIGRSYSAIFHIASDMALKTHFIGVMGFEGYTYKTQNIYALTDRQVLLDSELTNKVIRELDSIRKQNGYSESDMTRGYIFDGIYALNKNQASVTTYRKYNGYKKPRIIVVTNHIIEQREKEIADSARIEESKRLRQIMKERQMESDLISYQALDAAELKKITLGYYSTSLSQSDYYRAAESALGLKEVISPWMIHVSDVDDKQIKIDFPIEMDATSSDDFKEGWYIVDASLSGVLGKTDDSGYIQPKMNNMTIKQRCETEKCDEYTDPLTVVRVLNKMPQWTPKNTKD